VEQGKRIELDEITRWRKLGKADEVLAAAAGKAERLLAAALAGKSSSLPGQKASASPVSTLGFKKSGGGGGGEGDSGPSSPDSCAVLRASTAPAAAINGDEDKAPASVREENAPASAPDDAAAVGSSSEDVESQLNTTAGSTDVLLQAGLYKRNPVGPIA
jgi:hypothetical protein